MPEAQLDPVRTKCLLAHDRCELIKDHLERGAPLRVRKGALETLEDSLEGGKGSAESPVHQVEEEQVRESETQINRSLLCFELESQYLLVSDIEMTFM